MRISVEGRDRDLKALSTGAQAVFDAGVVFARRIAHRLWAVHLSNGSVRFLQEGDDFCLA